MSRKVTIALLCLESSVLFKCRTRNLWSRIAYYSKSSLWVQSWERPADPWAHGRPKRRLSKPLCQVLWQCQATGSGDFPWPKLQCNKSLESIQWGTNTLQIAFKLLFNASTISLSWSLEQVFQLPGGRWLLVELGTLRDLWACQVQIQHLVQQWTVGSSPNEGWHPRHYYGVRSSRWLHGSIIHWL